MNTQHTPGPWEVSHQLADGFSIAHEIAPNCGRLIPLATAHNVGGWPGYRLDDETAKANARLIAAAPELLAALESIANCDHFRMEQARLAARAIAKAKGEAP